MFSAKKATVAALALGAVLATGAPSVAQERAAPPALAEQPKVGRRAELNAELAALEKERAGAEKYRAEQQDKIAAAEKKLKAAIAQGDKTTINLARVELLLAQGDSTSKAIDYQQIEARARAIEEDLAFLAAAGASAHEQPVAEEPQPKPKAEPVPFKDLVADPAEIEEKLGNIERTLELERLRFQLLDAKLRFAEVQNGAVERAKADLATAKATVEAMEQKAQLLRYQFAAVKAMRVPQLDAVGACIEVVVVGSTDPWPCRVREYGRQGKYLGAVFAEDGAALELILTRALKDPGGPREFCLVASADHSPDAILRAAKAGKAAGFTKVRIYGTLPTGFKLPDGEARRDFNGTPFELNKLAP